MLFCAVDSLFLLAGNEQCQVKILFAKRVHLLIYLKQITFLKQCEILSVLTQANRWLVAKLFVKELQ